MNQFSAGFPSPRGRSMGGPNAALLVDFDNVTMGIRSDLQAQLHKLLNSEIIRGKVAVQRAYADWRRYPQYIVPLSEASIDLIFAPAFGSNKKNATDIRLAIDALELVFTRPEIGTFILLSGDSDFSSLVLKLKEYGKYVIGVGIRESASDLLVQNCDEYYSYSELTGLAKEEQASVVRRDPWELVVEAVTQMQRTHDVMRSDRLKQVMQTLDPHFDEKDAGFNKFSKFVVEASRRGLVTLRKMENGQHEVGVGPDANVLLQSGGDAPAGADDAARTPRVAEVAGGKDGMTLARSFDLLRSALEELVGAGEESATDEAVRMAMQERSGQPDDPLFTKRRFHRMLRQAHDASVVDLAKTGDGYRVRLTPVVPAEPDATEAPKKARTPKRSRTKTTATASATSVPQPDPAPAPDSAGAGGEGEEDVKPKRKRATKSKAKRAKKATTAKETDTAVTDDERTPDEAPESKRRSSSRDGKKTEASRDSESRATDRGAPVGGQPERSDQRTSSMRYRSGSRGVPRRPSPRGEQPPVAESATDVTRSAEHRPQLRLRQGSRTRGRSATAVPPPEDGKPASASPPPPPTRPEATSSTGPERMREDSPAQDGPRRRRGRSRPSRRDEGGGSRRGGAERPERTATAKRSARPKRSASGADRDQIAKTAPAKPDQGPADEPAETGSFFKRLTAAFQRARSDADE